MKLKKIPSYLLVLFFVLGSISTIGLLSFTGMYTLFPVVGVAFLALGFSVLYEGEIHFLNIKSALNKLFFKPDFLKHFFANDFLLKKFPDTSDEKCPQFFKDYEAQLRMQSVFNNKNLDKESKKRKEHIDKTLKDMQKWFALQLFSPLDNDEEEAALSAYAQELRQWLANHGQADIQESYKKRKKIFNAVKVFSVVCGVFMGLGTIYLLVDGFAVLPILAAIPFAALPAIIIPMAIVSGIGYSFLIYNAVTDMINNDTLRKWYHRIFRDGLRKEITLYNLFIATAAISLFALTIVMTICTAGTWWTIAKNTPPLFAWMSKMPTFIMGVINPIVTGIGRLLFDLENLGESLDGIAEAIKGNPFKKIWHAIHHGIKSLIANENWLQWLNPFRLLIKLSFEPLRFLSFLCHLVFMGVNADRVPGVPVPLSAGGGTLCEGIGDLHYFAGDLLHNHDEHEHGEHHHEHKHAGHNHDEIEHDECGPNKKKISTQQLLEEHFESHHDHDHSNDIPTRILRLCFSPLFFLGAGWDYLATRIIATPDDTKLSFKEAWDKQHGKSKKVSVELEEWLDRPSVDWQVEHSVYRIDRYLDKHLLSAKIDRKTAQEKVQGLMGLKHDLAHSNFKSEGDIKDRIAEEIEKPVYNTPRSLFKSVSSFFNRGNTTTQDFLGEKLPTQISCSAAA